MPNKVLAVAVPTPLRQTFDYYAPPNYQADALQVGCRVEVPFGRRSLVGIIIDVLDAPRFDASKVKAAKKILDDKPLLTKELIKLISWAAHYYHHPIGDAYATALPTLLRKGETCQFHTEKYYRLTELGNTVSLEDFSRAKKQREVIEILRSTDTPHIHHQDKQLKPYSHDVIKALIAKEILQPHYFEKNIGASDYQKSSPLPANEEQEKAISTINKNKNSFQPFLLNGITGSGKTEVYLQIIDSILESGKQVLVLIPEISLTPQTVSRFQQRFSQTVASMHSGLSDRERLDSWIMAKRGLAKIIIGTRSAIFTPFQDLGLIVIDEEHDSSFKQQDSFRYSARDLAIIRAKQLSIPVVLGSATPSFESRFNVLNERYQELLLTARTAGASKPKIELMDVRGQTLTAGVSPKLIQTIDAELKKDNQVLIFINRRGFAPVLFCHDCGWIADCPRCDAHLTIHIKPNNIKHLSCHHCDYHCGWINQCQNCGSYEVSEVGVGTQQLEAAMQKQFPNTGIVRIDRDNTRSKFALQEKLEKIQNNDFQILIGTQMLAKGHHFPNVTLVAIINADNGLFSTDFRATERLAQLITQVSGRAGRAEKPGRVCIQTHFPQHPILQSLLEQDYTAFSDTVLQERLQHALPPYTFSAVLRTEATQTGLPMQILANIKKRIKHSEVTLLGPVPQYMERKAGKYRAQLILLSANRKQLHQTIHNAITYISESSDKNRIRWSIDVDPYEL